jgi:hypothetical protein
MKKCGTCGTRIYLGGVHQGDAYYCNNNCWQQAKLHSIANAIPKDVLDAYVTKVFQGRCPHCGGSGPVDAHTSYRVYSVFIITRHGSSTKISCTRCGTKQKLLDTGFSLICGWWGFPWGLIMTPIQIGRNIVGLCSAAKSTNSPSKKLETILKFNLAKSLQQKNIADGKTNQTV